VRPHAQRFLKEMEKVGFEIVIFTCGEKGYANGILDKLDPNKKYISHRLFRDSCSTDKYGVFYKDLSKLGRDLSKTLIIDNLARNFDKQPDNGILITSWYYDSHDTELNKLELALKAMVKQQPQDVREFNKKVIRAQANEKT